MRTEYEARWASKRQAEVIKRTGKRGETILLDSMKGFIVIQPVGSNLADGDRLSARDADFELDPVWCLETKTKLHEARKRLGLTAGQLL